VLSESVVAGSELLATSEAPPQGRVFFVLKNRMVWHWNSAKEVGSGLRRAAAGNASWTMQGVNRNAMHPHKDRRKPPRSAQDGSFDNPVKAHATAGVKAGTCLLLMGLDQ
jgi:hypothetical protein